MWWDERSAAPPAMTLSATIIALDTLLLARVLALLAPDPHDVAAAAATCRAFAEALRGARLTRREWACTACGAVAFASDALQPQRPQRWAFLHDGPALAVDVDAVSATLVRTGKHVGESQAFRTYGNRLRALSKPCEPLSCGGCAVMLGARCVAHDGTSWAAVCEAYVVRRLVGGAPDPAPPPPRRTPGVLRCAGPVRGAGCGAVLAEHEAVLSKQHAWTAPPRDATGAANAAPVLQDAWYVNTLRRGAFVTRNTRPERLAQGNFDIDDVACVACDTTVGWRFSAYRPALPSVIPHSAPEPRRTHHENVGRFGLMVPSYVILVETHTPAP